MSVGTAAAIGIGLTAAGGVASSIIGANASKSAAQTQANAESQAAQVQQNALDYTKQVEAPFVSAGSTSIGNLMDAIKNGTFGPGSLPSLSLGTFNAPTLAEAQATPGYQFTATEGAKAINRGAAAAGGAFTGGTLKSLAQYGTNLADSTYGDVFNRALAGYQTNTNTAISQYQAALAKQAQEYQQLALPAQLGEAAASGAAANVGNESNALGQTISNIGTSQAAGTVGSANAITSGITGATNSISQGLLLNNLINSGAFRTGGGVYSGPIGVPGSPGYNAPTPYQTPG